MQNKPTTHTPTPKLSVVTRPDQSIELVTPAGVPIAIVSYRNLPWAHNIALAINNHQALVDALRKCKAAIEDQSLPPSARMELVRDYATPAIANAQGKGVGR